MSNFVRIMFGLILVVSTSIAGNALASTAKVLTPRGIGVSDELVKTYAELIRLYLRQAKHTIAKDGQQPELTFAPSITKVGEGYILGLEKKSADGDSYEDSFKVANENELDTGVKRLVSSVLSERAAEKSATVDDVTSNEVRAGIARQVTVKRVQVALGPTKAHGFGTDETLYNFELGYVWERDQLAPRAYSEFNIGPGIKEAFAVSAGLGLDYYLTNGKHAPFIGADVGLGGFHRASNSETKDGRPMFRSGFTLSATVGYAIMRTADTSMYVAASYRPVLQGFGDKSAGLYGVQVGLLY
ncbi:MAG: hypothetical protein FJ146_11590 [Deltaproteobacteria bacterium]|nr:hypothetical protein [Deltaproteobacteria bacterium]